MALAGTEVWRGGFVVDATSGQWITTTDPTGTSWWGGFKRDPDGRILTTTVSSQVVWHNGLPFDATTGALLVAGSASSGSNPAVTYAGAWSSTTAYKVGDLVIYGGKPYVCKVAVAAGTLPQWQPSNVAPGELWTPDQAIGNGGSYAFSNPARLDGPVSGMGAGDRLRALLAMSVTTAGSATINYAITNVGAGTVGIDVFQGNNSTWRGGINDSTTGTGRSFALASLALGNAWIIVHNLGAIAGNLSVAQGTAVVVPSGNTIPSGDAAHWDQVST